MAYNYSKLIGRIIEKCGTQAAFAKQMGLSERSISLKLNNKIKFKQNEIQRAIEILNLRSCDIGIYFFTLEVQNKRQ